MRLRYIIAVVLAAASADAAQFPLATNIRARATIPFYVRTPMLASLPVYPILTPTAGSLGVLAQVFGPSGGYTTVQDEGSGLTQRQTINFVGSGVSCVDNSGSTRTDCTISAAAGANAALSNLSAVSINASLIPQTTLDLGAAATPWRDLYLYGSGTYGTGSYRITGTPTANRVITLPNASTTLAGTTVTNTWTVFQDYTISGLATTLRLGSDNILAFGGSSQTALYWNTSQTPDTLFLAPATGVNTVLIGEIGDVTYDFAVPAQTNPTLVVASATQSVNERIGIRHNQTQPELTDLANTPASRRPWRLTGGSSVASAATITPTGDVFHVTGTVNIDTITIMGAGTRITLIFDGVLTVGDSTGNVKLSAGFTTSADDTLTLVSDGSSWFEVARSVN
jgi:hypothetical protein